MRVYRTLLLVAALGAMSAPAAAAGGKEETEAARREARQLFDEGSRLYAAGRYEEARVKYAESWSLMKNRNSLFNLARAEHKGNRLLDAARHYREYLLLDDPKVAKDRDLVSRYLADVHSRVGRIEVAAPAEAEIAIDGVPVDRTLAEPVEVEPGTHKVSGSLGGVKRESEVVAPAGTIASTTITFDEPRGPDVVAKTNHLAPTRAPDINLPRDEPDPGPRLSWLWPAGIGLGAVVAASVGLGFAVAHGSSSESADALRRTSSSPICADRSSPSCRTYEDKLATADAEGKVATKAFVGAGILAGIAVTLTAINLWPRSSTSSRAVALRVMSGGRVVVEGSF